VCGGGTSKRQRSAIQQQQVALLLEPDADDIPIVHNLNYLWLCLMIRLQRLRRMVSTSVLSPVMSEAGSGKKPLYPGRRQGRQTQIGAQLLGRLVCSSSGAARPESANGAATRSVSIRLSSGPLTPWASRAKCRKPQCERAFGQAYCEEISALRDGAPPMRSMSRRVFKHRGIVDYRALNHSIRLVDRRNPSCIQFTGGRRVSQKKK